MQQLKIPFTAHIADWYHRIQELKATVESLAKEVMALKCTEAVVGQPNPELPPTNQLKQQDIQQQLQQVTWQILKQDTLAPATVSAGTQESIATEKISRYNDEDRKFNDSRDRRI